MTTKDGEASNGQKAIGPSARLMQVSKEQQRNGLKNVVYVDHAASQPSDVVAFGREATWCFMDKRYLAAIMMASAMVEVILNKDSRLTTAGRHWDPLDMKSIRTAKKAGLPVERLLEPDETLKGKSILFLELRNKMAHGNLTGLIGFENVGTTDYSGKARSLALKHLEKSQFFEVDWFNCLTHHLMFRREGSYAAAGQVRISRNRARGNETH